MKIMLAGIAAVFSLYAINAHALDMFGDALPQSTGKTCQSYSAALAIAAKNDSEFKIETYGELRLFEQKFRQKLEQTGKPYDHSNWVKVMEEITGGKYSLDRKYVSDITVWMKELSEATIIDSDIDVLLRRLTRNSFDVVLTSVTSIAGSNYKTGHIIGVIGVIGDGLNSSTKLVAFNSAIKGEGGAGVMCDESHMTSQGDLSYKAGVLNTNDFQPSKGFLIMRLVKN